MSPRRPRILAVDDVPALRAYYVAALGDLAAVVTASDGSKALELIAEDPDFSVILCDVVMPGLDGVALFERLSAVAPQLRSRVVFCTSATERLAALRGRLAQEPLLQPVALGELRARVGALLRIS